MKDRIVLVLAMSCAFVVVAYFGYSAAGQSPGQQAEPGVPGVSGVQGLQGVPDGTRVPGPLGSTKIGDTPNLTPAAIPPIDGVSLVRDGVYRITDPRPLEQATRLLERKLGVPIWYEDPVWSFNGDLVHAADLPANRELATRYPDWRGPLVPRGGTFDVILPTAPATLRAANPVDLLETAIASHMSFRNPGEFKVLQFGNNEFSIVGARAANKDGQIVEQVPPLDRRVSFPEAERTLADTLNLISSAINVKLMVEFAGGPKKSRRVLIGANNEVAREVVARTMRMPGGTKASWTLSYMPDLHAYLLGARPVEVEVTAPGVVTQLQTLFWPKH